MRRSGAPSQLSGNAVKKPRFVPPGANLSSPATEPRPLTAKLASSNALEKVNCSETRSPDIVVIPLLFLLLLYLIVLLFSLEQVQRSLAAPVLSKTELEVQTPKSQTVTAAPALSRALARVLSATESKENEAERRHPDSCLDDHTTRNEAGKTQWLCDY